MTNLIVILVSIVFTVTVFSVKDSKKKKWPVLTVASTLIVELLLCLYHGESKIIHQITGIEYVLMLIILWILCVAPHVDNTNEESEKDSDSNTNTD